MKKLQRILLILLPVTLMSCASKGVKPSDEEVQKLYLSLSEGRLEEVTAALKRFLPNEPVPGILGPSILTGVTKPSTATLLHAGAIFSEPGAVETLIERKAQVNSRDNFGLTPLHAAIISEEVVAPKIVGDEVDEKWEGEFRGKQLQVVQALLKGGASVDLADECGRTPLFYAANYGLPSITKELLSKGANVKTVDENGDTPLIAAARSGQVEVAAEILNKGGEAGVQNKLGRTALHEAALYAQSDLVRLLLDRGGDGASLDKQGLTPIDLAVISDAGEFGDVVDQLKAKGGKVKTEDEIEKITLPDLQPEEEGLPWTCSRSKVDLAALPQADDGAESLEAAEEELQGLVEGLTPPQ